MGHAFSTGGNAPPTRGGAISNPLWNNSHRIATLERLPVVGFAGEGGLGVAVDEVEEFAAEAHDQVDVAVVVDVLELGHQPSVVATFGDGRAGEQNRGRVRVGGVEVVRHTLVCLMRLKTIPELLTDFKAFFHIRANAWVGRISR